MRLMLTLLGAGVLVAGATAANPAVKRTAAGASAATGSLLTSADLSKAEGWSAVSAGSDTGFPFSCTGWDPSTSGITVIGEASSPDYSTGGVEVLQATNVYATAHEASTMWGRAVKPRLTRCVVESVTEHGIDVRLLSDGTLALKKAGTMTAGYRVVADLYSAKNKTLRKTYFDAIFIGRDRTLSEITLSSFGVPVPPEIEYEIALTVYHRIG